MARMVSLYEGPRLSVEGLTLSRTADQSEGNKTVGVDPTIVTARM